jgi:hypothetical protein
MGLGSSKPEIPEEHVFQKEYLELNNLYEKVLSNDNLFKRKRYNLFMKGACDELTMVAMKRLDRHPKFELTKLRDQLVLVPNSEFQETKKDLCNSISMHYVKILKLLYVVKYVYDLEHHGDYSVAGILLRNIRLKDDLMEVRYCASRQEELGSYDKGVDFGKLSGFEVLVNELLTEKERAVFLGHLRELLNKKSLRFIKKWICKDLLVPSTQYSKIYEANMHCKQSGGAEPLYIKVGPQNAVFGWQLCTSPRAHISKMNKNLANAFRKFTRRYQDNITETRAQLMRLFKIQNGEVFIRDVTHPELLDIEREVKRSLIVFFVESIVSYQLVLEAAEKSSVNRNE